MICHGSIRRSAISCLSVFVVWTFFHSGRANCSNPDDIDYKEISYKKWEMLFSTGSYFTPNPFEDMTLALQRRISGRNSVRLEIGYSYNKFESHDIRYDQGIFDREFEKDTSRSELSLACCIVNYRNPGNRIRPYLGAGPFFAYSGRKLNTPEPDRNTEFVINDYSIGIKTLLGADYKIKSFLRFHAEYRLELYYRYTRRESNWINYFPGYTEEHIFRRSSKSFVVDKNDVRAGISIVF